MSDDGRDRINELYDLIAPAVLNSPESLVTMAALDELRDTALTLLPREWPHGGSDKFNAAAKAALEKREDLSPANRTGS